MQAPAVAAATTMTAPAAVGMQELAAAVGRMVVQTAAVSMGVLAAWATQAQAAARVLPVCSAASALTHMQLVRWLRHIILKLLAPQAVQGAAVIFTAQIACWAMCEIKCRYAWTADSLGEYILCIMQLL